MQIDFVIGPDETGKGRVIVDGRFYGLPSAVISDYKRLRNEICEQILIAMRDLHDNATDTVWLTPHETVFDRLAMIYDYAGGDPATLVATWPEYFM